MLTIIIVSHNSESYLERCLRTVFDNSGTLPKEVFVVDNKSSDNTVKQTLAAFPQVQVIENAANVGFAKACNQVLRMASGRFILLLNPDTEVREQAIQRMVEYMQEHSSIGVLGPRVLNPDGTVQGSARAYPTFLTAFFGRRALMTRLFPTNSLTVRNVPSLQPALNEPIEVDWVSGAALMMRAEVLPKVGLLDENFFLFWEDADWCYRIKKAGWNIFYYPHAQIVHHVGKSVATQPFQSVVEFHRSAYRFYCKHNVINRISMKRVLAFAGIYFRMILQLGVLLFRQPGFSPMHSRLKP